MFLNRIEAGTAGSKLKYKMTQYCISRTQGWCACGLRGCKELNFPVEVILTKNRPPNE